MQEEPPKPDAEVEEPVAEEVEPKVSDAPSGSGVLDKHKHRLRRFKTWYGTHKKWSIPVTVLLLLLILAGIPFTRYNIAGLVLKKNFTVQVTDSTAHTAVSGASVSSGSVEAQTDANGVAVLRLKVGPHKFSVSKEYYQTRQLNLVVPLLKENNPAFDLVATGRQVNIHVTNLINGSVLSGVDIAVGNTDAKTNSSGNALVVVPAGNASQSAKLSLDGYNDDSVTIHVSNTSVEQNNFKLTPAGKIYYLDDSTGKQNVMEANLDGTDPQVAVAASGYEDTSTSLMQSADGKYVALVAKRTATDQTAQIYVLAAADNKLLEIDSGDTTFAMDSWSGDTLIYNTDRLDLPTWQVGASQLKAYDATSGSTTLLDQSAGSDATTDINQTYNDVLVSGSQVVYDKLWSSTDPSQLTGKQNTIEVIGVNGQGHEVVAGYDATTNAGLSLIQYSPVNFYIYVVPSDGSASQIFQYTVGSTVKSSTLTSDQLYQDAYSSFYFTADNNQTLWSEVLDGNNTLFVGNATGTNPATAATNSDYSAYGWYTDSYILVSKNNNELDIMSAKGSTPIKVANYQANAEDGGL